MAHFRAHGTLGVGSSTDYAVGECVGRLGPIFMDCYVFLMVLDVVYGYGTMFFLLNLCYFVCYVNIYFTMSSYESGCVFSFPIFCSLSSSALRGFKL